jgi:glycosyltransferase involved in cell wall biosynthesis
MPRVLFIASHRPDRSPNQRYRFEQYIPYLQQNGFECDLSYIVQQSDDEILYRPGHIIQKMGFVARSYARRRRDLKVMDEYDIIFICREALMTRSTYFERKFTSGKARTIYDFDDSIWLSNVSDANRRWRFMKDPGKTSKIIGMVDLIFAGNDYLANYAKQFNQNVKVIPTTIDSDEYRPIDVRQQEGPVCIGWTGSITTVQHFQYARPAILKLKKIHGDRITFRVIGDPHFEDRELGIKGIRWKRETEVKDLEPIHIGIMPLPDDEWARGKCGLKGLQYMGMAIPPVMSPVGVNTRIVQDGVNGFLAGPVDEWVEKIGRLIEDPELRGRLGAAARRSVEQHWSVKAWRDVYLQHFTDLLSAR